MRWHSEISGAIQRKLAGLVPWNGSLRRSAPLCERAPVGIVLLAGDGTVLHANRAWRRTMVGDLAALWPGDDFLDRAGRAALDGDGRIVAGLKEIIAGHTECFAATLAGKAGSAWYRMQAGGIKGMGNARLVVLAMDVTELVRAQQGLRDALTTAEAATTSRTRFLATAAHDLRQPAQAISLIASVLDRRLRETEHAQVARQLATSVDVLCRLLDHVLDISRLDAGQVRAEVVDVPLAPLIGRLGEEFAMMAQAQGLTVRCVPSSLRVRTDPTLLERILRNLLSNALRNTPSGRVLLGCRRAGAVARIQVWDTGVGIASDRIDAIFEEFYRIGAADTDGNGNGAGLGLGLAIVRRLADLLRLPLAVRSQPGRGSMFEVAVPLAITRPDTEKGAGKTPAP